jgi:prepilin-type N-terminal cleavage/methylation domain-containing protein
MKELTTATERSTGGARQAGFTLIELLTVISIMAVLAGIGAGAAGVAMRKANENRSRAALASLVTAIESFRNDFNQYPQDNARVPNSLKDGLSYAAVNPLYYELEGTISTNQGAKYFTVDRDETIIPASIQKYFGRDGLLNAVDGQDRTRRPKQYLSSLKKNDRGEISTQDDIEALLVPVKWPNAWRNITALGDDKRPPLQGFSFAKDPRILQLNPWHYVSTGPTNNPTGFDLWGRVPIGSQVRLVANWNVASEVTKK